MMKTTVNRDGLEIHVEGALEMAFVEEVLGLRKDGADVRLVRCKSRYSSRHDEPRFLVDFKLKTREFE